MKADPETEAEVIAVLDRLAEGYNSRDADAVMALFADDTDLVVFGTGDDERCIGPAEILVSSLLREITESGGDIPFGEEREAELKGLSGTYRLHEVL